MKFLAKYFIGFMLVLVGCSFAYSLNVSKSDASKVFDQGIYCHRNARIMEINLAGAEMIVAEKVVKLATYIDKKGRIQYLTQLLDASGKKITLGDFNVRERVVVEGVKLSDGTIIAGSITKSK